MRWNSTTQYLPEDHNETEHWDDWNETDPIFDHNYSDEYDPIDDFEDWNDSDFDPITSLIQLRMVIRFWDH